MFKKIIKKLIFWTITKLKYWEYRTHYCYGAPERLHVGENVSLTNTLFNLASGDIYIGDNVIFGHNCMLLTGRHEFVEGRRKSLVNGGSEAPLSGYDIRIGNGCWIASGATIVAPVTIGDNTIVAAGSMVTKDMPQGVFVAGVPARVVKNL